MLLRDGPPARLVAGIGDSSDGIVVNNMRPVQLTTRVLDTRGHVLGSGAVRYQRMSGAELTLSPQGALTCEQRGDATVRASLGTIITDVDVHCRPVKELRASTWVDLVAGDPPRDLPFVATGVDDRPVLQLRGAARVLDSSVAALEGTTIRPRGIGQTSVSVDVGDRRVRMEVVVHEPVNSFVGLRADQRFVAVPVRLARGDTLHWNLFAGAFWLRYVPRQSGGLPPTIAVNGAISCAPGDGLMAYRLPLEEVATYCIVRPGGATVTLAHGATGAAVIEGSLALDRVAR